MRTFCSGRANAQSVYGKIFHVNSATSRVAVAATQLTGALITDFTGSVETREAAPARSLRSM
jgi:hypothetical protein